MADKKKEPETPIDLHVVGRSSLMGFVAESKTRGVYEWRHDDAYERLRDAAEIEDKEGREFALSLLDKLTSMRKTADELRKRFTTLESALTKVNEQTLTIMKQKDGA